MYIDTVLRQMRISLHVTVEGFNRADIQYSLQLIFPDQNKYWCSMVPPVTDTVFLYLGHILTTRNASVK